MLEGLKEGLPARNQRDRDAQVREKLKDGALSFLTLRGVGKQAWRADGNYPKSWAQ